jgi:hypothetical protein
MSSILPGRRRGRLADTSLLVATMTTAGLPLVTGTDSSFTSCQMIIDLASNQG